jgi:EAL and modified HD-GYP domain-containing signal transduction protein
LSDSGILGQVALSYSAFIDRNRAVIATRLTVFPLRPDAVLDVAQLLHEVGNVWPASGARVSLNVVSESLLQDLMRARPSANLMVEVPAFMAVDPENTKALIELHASGSTLLLKGRPLRELPRDVLPCFKYSMIDLADDRRLGDSPPPPGVTRSIAHVQSGVRSVADMDGCFARGAQAVLG